MKQAAEKPKLDLSKFVTSFSTSLKKTSKSATPEYFYVERSRDNKQAAVVVPSNSESFTDNSLVSALVYLADKAHVPIIPVGKEVDAGSIKATLQETDLFCSEFVNTWCGMTRIGRPVLRSSKVSRSKYEGENSATCRIIESLIATGNLPKELLDHYYEPAFHQMTAVVENNVRVTKSKIIDRYLSILSGTEQVNKEFSRCWHDLESFILAQNKARMLDRLNKEALAPTFEEMVSWYKPKYTKEIQQTLKKGKKKATSTRKVQVPRKLRDPDAFIGIRDCEKAMIKETTRSQAELNAIKAAYKLLKWKNIVNYGEVLSQYFALVEREVTLLMEQSREWALKTDFRRKLAPGNSERQKYDWLMQECKRPSNQKPFLPEQIWAINNLLPEKITQKRRDPDTEEIIDIVIPRSEFVVQPERLGLGYTHLRAFLEEYNYQKAHYEQQAEAEARMRAAHQRSENQGREEMDPNDLQKSRFGGAGRNPTPAEAAVQKKKEEKRSFNPFSSSSRK
jgi:hypothetical protein